MSSGVGGEAAVAADPVTSFGAGKMSLPGLPSPGMQPGPPVSDFRSLIQAMLGQSLLSPNRMAQQASPGPMSLLAQGMAAPANVGAPAAQPAAPPPAQVAPNVPSIFGNSNFQFGGGRGSLYTRMMQ